MAIAGVRWEGFTTRESYAWNFLRRGKLSYNSLTFDLRTKQSQLPKDVVIACVSSCIRVDAGSELYGKSKGDPDDLKAHLCREDVEKGYKILKINKELTPENWMQMRETEFSKALEKKPDVICFPEFSYLPADDTLNTLFYRFTQKLADVEDKPFVFAGSYHCPNSKRHIGMVFSPLSLENRTIKTALSVSKKSSLDGGEAIIRPKGYYKHNEPIKHYKRYPARRLGEETVVPVGTEFHVYETDFAKIAILICSDALDLNQSFFMAYENMTTSKHSIDMVLIPAFNPSPALVNFCRELSGIANVLVVAVNANHYVDKFPPTEAFYNGETIRDTNIEKYFDIHSLAETHVSHGDQTVGSCDAHISFIKVKKEFWADQKILSKRHPLFVAFKGLSPPREI